MRFCLVGILFSLVSFVSLSSAQLIDTSECGKSAGCFREPPTCAGSTSCNILISYKHNASSMSIDVAISSKNKWLAFGVSSSGKQMDKTTGEICMEDSSTAKLIAFSNSGYSPDFSKSTSGLRNIKTSIISGAVVCRYQRPLTGPANSYMKDMKQKLYINAVYGDRISGSNPRKHEKSGYSSSSKVDFTKTAIIGSGAAGKNINFIAHGSLMIIAWMSFAATGMFIARYTRPVANDSKLCGEKVWFQSHRICMVVTLLLTIVGIIIIFAHVKGWSENAKAHPVLGCLTVILAIVQPIMAACRPHPGGEKRWIFNWAHRSVGLCALILSVVTVFLGLKLISVSMAPVIAWVAVAVLLILVMEIGPCFLPNVLSTDVDMSADQSGEKASSPLVEDKTIKFRIVVFCLAFLSFFAIGFATIAMVAKTD